MADAVARTARSATLVVALIVGAVLVIGSALGAIPALAGIFGDIWNGRADLLTGRAPALGGGSDAAETNYAGVIISADAALATPRMLQAVAALLAIGLVVCGGLLLVLLSLRMLRSRPFARLLAWGLGVVGLLAVVVAAVAPQLEVLAVDLAVQELDLPLYDASHDGMFTADGADAIALALWDPLWILDRVDPALMLLGLVLGALGLLTAHGVRLQRETEGLI